jgi:hypothetical protein
MKTLTIYSQLILLPIFGLLLLGLHSCVAPTDIDDKGNVIIEPPPFVPAALFEPKEVEFNLDQETNLAPSEDIIRPLWANKLEHAILIDTNKINGRELPRILLRFDAISLPNGFRLREPNGFSLKRISINLPDTIDLNDEVDLKYTKDELPNDSNFFIYTYKGNDVKVLLKEDAFVNFRFAKIEKRNRIIVQFNFSVFIQVNGLNNGQKQHGKGQFIVNY